MRRRYARSLVHLRAVVDLADSSKIFDHSGLGNTTLAAELAGDQVLYRASVLPLWLVRSLADFLHGPT